jgi:DNA-binding NarL/FixJ family response regulator
MNNKKVYKIGDNIKVEDLQEVARGITKKAINVIATNGDKIAIELQENKHIELYQDILQEVATQIILNNYVITKECYKIVRSYIYKKNRDIIELIIDNNGENENDFANIQDKKAYINFINEYKQEQKSKVFNINILLEGLTSRQKEIISIYAKTNSMQKTADLLGIKKSSVSDCIYTIRNKIKSLCYEIA